MTQSQVIDACLSQAQRRRALHTFGYDLNRNVHAHRSITCGGLTDDKSRLSSLLLSAENRG
ncbi:transposase [Endozoicomonas sp. ISHI1]|uniref:transposase n=1 Tax=Endozoicomonas sp. ISHI1 TaxID=2825882 RepID=UPI00359F4994